MPASGDSRHEQGAGLSSRGQRHQGVTSSSPPHHHLTTQLSVRCYDATTNPHAITSKPTPCSFPLRCRLSPRSIAVGPSERDIGAGLRRRVKRPNTAQWIGGQRGEGERRTEESDWSHRGGRRHRGGVHSACRLSLSRSAPISVPMRISPSDLPSPVSHATPTHYHTTSLANSGICTRNSSSSSLATVCGVTDSAAAAIPRCCASTPRIAHCHLWIGLSTTRVRAMRHFMLSRLS